MLAGVLKHNSPVSIHVTGHTSSNSLKPRCQLNDNLTAYLQYFIRECEMPYIRRAFQLVALALFGCCTALPGEVNGLLTGHSEVEVGGVFHLICVSCFLYPVTNRMAVHSIHDVTLIIWTTPVMARTTSWWQRRLPAGQWPSTHSSMFYFENMHFYKPPDSNWYVSCKLI